MNLEQLREKLTQLHDELEHTEGVDENTRALLVDLSNDIQEVLNRPDDEEREYGTLTGRLRAGVERFEATHPHLTSAMERAIDALVQMGV